LTCIVKLFPQAALLPTEDPISLAHAYELMSWLASTVHVSIAQIWRTERFTHDPSAATSLRRDGVTNILASYQVIDGMIEGNWVLGDRYSVLDPYLLVFWRWGARLSIDMSTFPKWSAHTARVMARPAVIRALAREAQQMQEQKSAVTANR
jgi:glutathione S-transferase